MTYFCICNVLVHFQSIIMSLRMWTQLFYMYCLRKYETTCFNTLDYTSNYLNSPFFLNSSTHILKLCMIKSKRKPSRKKNQQVNTMDIISLWSKTMTYAKHKSKSSNSFFFLASILVPSFPWRWSMSVWFLTRRNPQLCKRVTSAMKQIVCPSEWNPHV